MNKIQKQDYWNLGKSFTKLSEPVSFLEYFSETTLLSKFEPLITQHNGSKLRFDKKVSETDENNSIITMKFLSPWIVTFVTVPKGKPFVVQFSEIQVHLRLIDVAPRPMSVRDKIMYFLDYRVLLRKIEARAIFELQVPVLFTFDKGIKLESLKSMDASFAQVLRVYENATWQEWQQRYGLELDQIVKWNMNEAVCILKQAKAIPIGNASVVVQSMTFRQGSMVVVATSSAIKATITCSNTKYARVTIELQTERVGTIVDRGCYLNPFGIQVPDIYSVASNVLCSSFVIRMMLNLSNMSLFPQEICDGIGFEATVACHNWTSKTMKPFFECYFHASPQTQYLHGYLNTKNQIVIRTMPDCDAYMNRGARTYAGRFTENRFLFVNMLPNVGWTFFDKSLVAEFNSYIMTGIGVNFRTMEYVSTMENSCSIAQVSLLWNWKRKQIVIRKKDRIVLLVETAIITLGNRLQTNSYKDVQILFT